jgi:HK97 family phage major capsid protein
MTAQEIAQKAIEAYKAAEAQKAAAQRSTPAIIRGLNDNKQDDVKSDLTDVRSRQLIFARMVRAAMVAKATHGTMAPFACRSVVESWQKQVKNPMNEYILEKTMTADALATGGAFVTTEIAEGIIELLQAATAVRGTAGVDVRVNTTGSLKIKRLDSGATANWIGEAQSIAPSSLGTGYLELSAKKLGLFVPMSNDLVRRQDANIDVEILNSLKTTMAVAEDLAFLRGTGTVYQPLGIYGAIDQTNNAFTMTATPTVLTVTTDANKLMNAVQESNIPIVNPVWYMRPKIKNYLQTLRDTNGYNLAFPEIAANGTWFGAEIRTTTSIPANLGAGTATEIYYGEASALIIADTLNMSVTQVDNVTYLDSNGSTVYGSQTDESAVRIIHETDFALRHNTAFARLDGVTWA